ncbi:tRNA dihydrouridine synthase DusB [Clostridium cellulovorans]|uniref:tRNA-dihydrouridine synthase n=1 Tax=Clostridium cellulovorans (strain ATCC 35296 / DSM 3052 / OCM 3 / 743B) TaxID=573061 RepID=D9SXE9_CLOC7|nr:tRNA dihydrouridine synthase DusB [Clostridium cellulovorans]ADL53452.1 TIM-barrel protein, nifR3 family [Clostridium cellulovorans 743B]
MKIGNLEFKNNVFLAPMAGVTDSPFRTLCLEQGCGLVYTEMVSAKGLFYGSENTEALLKVIDEERPVAVQIFGRDPYIMAKACEYFDKKDEFCIIDVNMGCPAPKIVKNGEGSALMKEPELAYEIVKTLKNTTSKPVTVKFRKGFDEDNINAVEFAKVIEEAGADAIAVHGRTRAQMYQGKADWNIIAQVKKAVTIPVIGNGDVFSHEDAQNLIHISNCDGIMVARGSQGNPWLFNQIKQKLSNEEIKYPTGAEKIDMCIRHYQLELMSNEEVKAVREMRKHIAFYVKGLKDCTVIRNAVNYETDAKKVIDLLLKYKENII